MTLKHATTVVTADDGTSEVGSNEWNAGHVVDVDGIPISSRTNDTDVATPASGVLALYAKDIAARGMLKWKDDDGQDWLVQPHIGTNGCRLWLPGAGTTAGTSPGSGAAVVAALGSVVSGTHGTTPTGFVQVALASTSLLTQTRRTTLATGTGASGNGVYLQGPVLECWRGNGAGLGGFFFTVRFAVSTLIASSRVFVGLVDVVTAPAATVDYLAAGTTTPGRIGLSINANTGNWQLNRTATGSAPTNVDLGATMPNTASQFMELILYCKPNDSLINYRVTNLTTGAVVTGNVSSNIPANTAFLTPRVHLTNNAATNTVLDFSKLYLETDF